LFFLAQNRLPGPLPLFGFEEDGSHDVTVGALGFKRPVGARISMISKACLERSRRGDAFRVEGGAAINVASTTVCFIACPLSEDRIIPKPD
jgi:hypothetical protein